MNNLPQNNTLIIENQYFACINYCLISIQISNIKIEACEAYQKMSFRNRCVIAGANGLVNLTIPLQNGRQQKAFIRDVKIDNNTRWQTQHWRSILSAYSKAPFFEFYTPALQPFFEKRVDFLFDHNWEIVCWLKKVLKIEAEISVTETFEKTYPDAVIDYRNKWLPKNFQSIGFPIQYQQVFQDKYRFQPNLSILDLLFNEGPNSHHLLRQQNL